MRRTSDEQEMQTGPRPAHPIPFKALGGCTRLGAALAPSAARFSHWLAAHNLSTRCIPLKAISTLSRVAFLVFPAASWPVSLVRVLDSGHHYHFQLHGSRGYPRPAQHFSDLVYVATGAIRESVRTFLPLFPVYRHAISTTTCQGTVTPLLSSLSCQGK